jgi:hypothetical protein
MRHILLPPPAGGPLGMGSPPSMAALITFAGFTQGAAPGQLGAVRGTVNLPTVTKAANKSLTLTPRTHQQPRWPVLTTRATLGGAEETWTSAMFGGIIALHSCPAQCGARRRA